MIANEIPKDDDLSLAQYLIDGFSTFDNQIQKQILEALNHKLKDDS